MTVVLCAGVPAHAQELVQDTVVFEKAKVLEVVSQGRKNIPGTGTEGDFQTIRAQVLEGGSVGRELVLDNDYLLLRAGDVFYLRHSTDVLDGTELWSVSDPYRIPTLYLFGGLFLLCLVLFGGIQGLRGLLALALSVFFISYLLLPGILQGYSPIVVSIGVSGLIIILGSYITHGFSRTTSAAVLGMLATVAVTGFLAYAAIHSARLSGFNSEEVVYLNFNTHGSIDFVGLLLGGLLIGFLGVLYDAGIGQAMAVEELLAAGRGISRAEVYRRALRLGREHVGALVNTLAIAYVGAFLPLLLFFMTVATQSFEVTVNQELFATEILRILIGSIGVIISIPITTAVAVWMLYGRDILVGASPHIHRH